MTYKKYIFDIGANDGLDGIALAAKNKDAFVHAFEPNSELISKIHFLKEKIEKRIGRKLNNYMIHNKAISNINAIREFNIAKNHTASSLYEFTENIDTSWPGYKNDHFHTIKKIKVKLITLKKFLEDNNINIINYLHIDTQGNDLNVLKGLGDKKKIVKQGVLEAAISKDKSLYKNIHTLKDIKEFFSISNFNIKKIVPLKHRSIKGTLNNEVNVYFYNNNYSNFFDVKTKYNRRYFYRLLNNKTYIKDDFKDLILRTLNRFWS